MLSDQAVWACAFQRTTVARTRRSFLAEVIFQEWADGIIRASFLARLAKAAKRDGLDIPMNNTFATVGSEELTNCARDLNKVLEDSGAFDHTTKTDGEFFHWCIMPSEVIRLLSRRESTFKKHLCPSVESCEMFWRDLFSTEDGMQYKQLHPHLKHKTVAQLKTSIACRVHGDAGPYTKVSGVNVVSWSSMHGRGIDLETKYHSHIIVPRKHNTLGRSRLNQFLVLNLQTAQHISCYDQRTSASEQHILMTKPFCGTTTGSSAR